ncbi:hypothetical protein TSAR_002296 [Trichomalopsis sarcophagae]|uniref:Uncharacterized protein n=1 Tax=Trichomalopsis sarcophagae TaxID=543379 RepID=A0A232EG61_9HYME|nr:hypothetical protein TSAR_002296 [Trichomalopsis sarcophagae]
MVLLAPEYKAIDVYMLNLIITCVMLCPEEFGNCIFKGEKIAHVSKEMILTKMYRNFSKSDMNKLNNTLDKYNLYLQKKSIDFVNNVLKHRALKHIQERQPFVRLETQKSQEDSQSSFESQSFLETRSADSTGDSSAPRSSFSHLTMEEINDLIAKSIILGFQINYNGLLRSHHEKGGLFE